MTTYKIEFVKSAQKEMKKLPHDVSLRINKQIKKLSENPRVGNVRPMVGSKSWRLRASEYRVVYDINDKKITILIIRGRHRKNAYK